MAWANALPMHQLAWDNDVFSLYRNNNSHVVSKVAEYSLIHAEPPALPSIVVFEAHSGFEKVRAKNGVIDSRFEESERQLHRLIEEMTNLSFDARAAKLAALLCPRLGGPNIGKLWKDVFIASTAYAHGYGVATQNKRDFRRIGELIPASQPPLLLAIWKSSTKVTIPG